MLRAKGIGIMILLNRINTTKKVDFHGIEFEVQECFTGRIEADKNGRVWAIDFSKMTIPNVNYKILLGVVDLEGMYWSDTGMWVD